MDNILKQFEGMPKISSQLLHASNDILNIFHPSTAPVNEDTPKSLWNPMISHALFHACEMMYLLGTEFDEKKWRKFVCEGILPPTLNHLSFASPHKFMLAIISCTLLLDLCLSTSNRSVFDLDPEFSWGDYQAFLASLVRSPEKIRTLLPHWLRSFNLRQIDCA